MLVLGTRPEAIKLAPVVRAMTASAHFQPLAVTTGQHREMLHQMLEMFQACDRVELDVMRERQQLSALTARLINGLGEVIREQKPDLVVVQGDTTTALTGALAAFYERVPVAHVEAGLRTGVSDNPFPEEINRRLIARVARWHFAPTDRAADHLKSEGVAESTIFTTGNTVIDNLLWVLSHGTGRNHFNTDLHHILLTLHRRENQGETMRHMGSAIRRLGDRGDVEILLPLHKSPAVREALLPELTDHPNIRVVEPLDYMDFSATLAGCDLVLTDSGGIQEEAPTLGKPTLVLRTTTERPEAVEVGAAKLVGVEPDAIVDAAVTLLDDHAAYTRMANAGNPFGDGHAADRIVAQLAADLPAHTGNARGTPTRRSLAGSAAPPR